MCGVNEMCSWFDGFCVCIVGKIGVNCFDGKYINDMCSELF